MSGELVCIDPQELLYNLVSSFYTENETYIAYKWAGIKCGTYRKSKTGLMYRQTTEVDRMLVDSLLTLQHSGAMDRLGNTRIWYNSKTGKLRRLGVWTHIVVTRRYCYEAGAARDMEGLIIDYLISMWRHEMQVFLNEEITRSVLLVPSPEARYPRSYYLTRFMYNMLVDGKRPEIEYAVAEAADTLFETDMNVVYTGAIPWSIMDFIDLSTLLSSIW